MFIVSITNPNYTIISNHMYLQDCSRFLSNITEISILKNKILLTKIIVENIFR